MSRCPWARCWTQNCSWCAPCIAASAMSEGPSDELATCPGSTLPSPRDSWDWLQQKTLRPHNRDKAVTGNGWNYPQKVKKQQFWRYVKDVRVLCCRVSSEVSMLTSLAKDVTLKPRYSVGGGASIKLLNGAWSQNGRLPSFKITRIFCVGGPIADRSS